MENAQFFTGLYVHHLTVHHRRTPCFPCPLATGMIATETNRTSGK